MKKYLILSILLFLIYSCNSDDDQQELVEFDFTYTQAEKDAEKAWIENYIEENEIPAISTASGLFYVIEQQGEGLYPEEEDTVIAHFITTIPETGEEISRSNRENNPHGTALVLNQLLPGVKEGFLLANEGSIITMIVPSFLAFGKQGNFDGTIPPQTTIMFDFELNIVLKQ